MAIPIGHSYRFMPTDEELCSYLWNKIHGYYVPPYTINTIEGGVYARAPRDLDWTPVSYLPNHERYYFSRRVRVSTRDNGKRVKRQLESSEETGGGYWRASTGDQKVFNSQNQTIGYRKLLKFHAYQNNNNAHNRKQAKPTEWIMHEYRLAGDTEWVVCRIKDKNIKKRKPTPIPVEDHAVGFQSNTLQSNNLIDNSGTLDELEGVEKDELDGLKNELDEFVSILETVLKDNSAKIDELDGVDMHELEQGGFTSSLKEKLTVEDLTLEEFNNLLSTLDDNDFIDSNNAKMNEDQLLSTHQPPTIDASQEDNPEDNEAMIEDLLVSDGCYICTEVDQPTPMR
ncbi:NAC domain containing protein [Trema orientale]|uniref:NAC domain containing protein n=1 Tax=Trema orientale TaxID=63057 RepID=A0A2P5FW84_TREOI|nr:NAC domain containing protein [Trema orientale]